MSAGATAAIVLSSIGFIMLHGCVFAVIGTLFKKLKRKRQAATVHYNNQRPLEATSSVTYQQVYPGREGERILSCICVRGAKVLPSPRSQ